MKIIIDRANFIYRFEIKEIVETACLLLKNLKSLTKTNKKYNVWANSDLLTTQNGRVTLGHDQKGKRSNKLAI